MDLPDENNLLWTSPSTQDVLTDVSVSMEKVSDGLLGIKPCFVHRVRVFSGPCSCSMTS